MCVHVLARETISWTPIILHMHVYICTCAEDTLSKYKTAYVVMHDDDSPENSLYESACTCVHTYKYPRLGFSYMYVQVCMCVHAGHYNIYMYVYLNNNNILGLY